MRELPRDIIIGMYSGNVMKEDKYSQTYGHMTMIIGKYKIDDFGMLRRGSRYATYYYWYGWNKIERWRWKK